MIFIGDELGLEVKSPLAKVIDGQVVNGSGGEKEWVVKGSGGEKVGGEWVSDEKVSDKQHSGESCNTLCLNPTTVCCCGCFQSVTTKQVVVFFFRKNLRYVLGLF